ncbi:MAG: ATP-binding cassette domain-containing protein, partial [Gemmatimonadota bacterium]|nr:ATP-binding cassette domain-containing protein [Gemmatimonadota bacterium]
MAEAELANTRSGEAIVPDIQNPIVTISNLSLYYGETQALFDIDMQIPEYRVTALIGPSGCGKSTLLRCMNRLNDLIDSVHIEGVVEIDNDDIYGPGYDVISLRRQVGMVFQKPNPFAQAIY